MSELVWWLTKAVILAGLVLVVIGWFVWSTVEEWKRWKRHGA